MSAPYLVRGGGEGFVVVLPGIESSEQPAAIEDQRQAL